MNDDKKPVPARVADERKAAPTRMVQDVSGPPHVVREAPTAEDEMRGVGIRVHLVEWERHMKLPGRMAEQHAKTEVSSNGNAWMIHYLPELRHFRIVFTDQARKTTAVRYVPVERALSWEPAP